jgi:hypothetical protein
MKKTVCDFCGKDVDSGGIQFRYRGKLYRMPQFKVTICDLEDSAISIYGTCPVCTIKLP